MDGSEQPGGSERDSASCAAPEPGSLADDREIASSAVLLVLGGLRKGTVHLCSTVAELLRENHRLQRTVEAQRAQIQLLRNMPPTARAMWPQTRTSSSASCYSLASLSTSQDSGVSSSCSSSGRGSMSPGVPLPGLPLLSTPQQNVPTAHRRPAVVHSHKDTSHLELQVPLTNPHPSSPRPPHYSSPQLHRRAFTFSRSERNPKGELSSRNDVQASEIWHKKKGKMASNICKEDLNIAQDLGNLGLQQRCSPEPSSSSQHDAGEMSSYLRHTLRPKHHLKINDCVILDGKRKGSVRFIGPLQNSTTGEVFIGVELDTACGESDGTFHGIQYFNSKPNYATFTTVSHIKKLSSLQHQPIIRSDSDRGVTSATGLKSRLQRTRTQKNITALIHWEPESSTGP